MDIVTALRRGAKECAKENIAGWGNTMTSAADEIETLKAENRRLKDDRRGHVSVDSATEATGE